MGETGEISHHENLCWGLWVILRFTCDTHAGNDVSKRSATKKIPELRVSRQYIHARALANTIGKLAYRIPVGTL